MKNKNAFLWIFAILFTLGSAYYQRLTGPTHPARGKVQIAGTEVSYSLIRSFPRPTDAPVRITVADTDIKGYFRFKRYPSHDDWQEMQLEREDDMLIAYIPHQPPAGKVNYQIFLQKGNEEVKLTEDPITIRFRGDVPAWALIPHIILMFMAMLYSTRAGLAAIFSNRTSRLTLYTVIFLAIGGLILGPVVQKFAFGAYWTGWPFGTDLTDNKTLAAFVVWVIALIKTRKDPNHRWWVMAASIILLLIYLIPHSTMGSEIDWTEEGTVPAAEMAELMVVSVSRFMFH